VIGVLVVGSKCHKVAAESQSKPSNVWI
jgi:hypothetical protein